MLRTVAILIFDDVEVLDFTGPFEVFSVTGRRDGSNPFDVFTVSQDGNAVAARNNLIVTPKYSFADCPRADILVIPGGYGTRREMLNEKVLDFLRDRAQRAEPLTEQLHRLSRAFDRVPVGDEGRDVERPGGH